MIIDVVVVVVVVVFERLRREKRKMICDLLVPYSFITRVAFDGRSFVQCGCSFAHTKYTQQFVKVLL